MKSIDIVLIGQLASVDLVLADRLITEGYSCVILRNAKKQSIKQVNSNFTEANRNDITENIKYFTSKKELLFYCRDAKMIISFTGSLLIELAELWFLKSLIGLPPIINVTTGSDITELVKEKTFFAFLYRKFMNKVDFNWCLPYPHALNNIIKFRIPNVIFIPTITLPTIDIENISDYYFQDTSDKNTIKFFHPSNLDWGITDNRIGRNSTKGNDKFIYAFKKAIDNGVVATCTILERGPDVAIAKALVEELGLNDYFSWFPHLTRDELLIEYLKADVVIDQFDVGAFGGVTIEAMSVGKPVLVYINEKCHSMLYSQPMPILNCRSENDIFSEIMKCKNRQYIDQVGKESIKWIKEVYNPKIGINRLLFYYAYLTGDIREDYGVQDGRQ